MLAEGATVGGFELVRRIGAGASGQVFEARDPRLERRVAIKLLVGARLATPEQLERFRRECEALARVDHPHVLRVHTAGTAEGIPYVVTELLPGRTLRDLLRQGRPPIETAARLALEVARGLSALHALGLVHRDVKPQNVLLDEAGRAKVADLGIATSPEERTLTRSGAVIGTPEYMSPEGLRGEQVREPTADVYSLGVVLYELLCGERPHPAPSLAQLVFLRTVNPARDVRELAPAVPPPLAAVCMQALALRPEERWPDAARFALALEAALAAPAPRRVPALLLLPAVALAGLVAWQALAAPIASLPGPTPAPRPTPAPPSPGQPWLNEAEGLAAGLLAGVADPGSAAATRLARLEAEPLSSWPVTWPEGEPVLAGLDDGGALHGDADGLVRRLPGLPPTRVPLAGSPSGLARGTGGEVLAIHGPERVLSLLEPGALTARPFAPLEGVRLLAGAGRRWLAVHGPRTVSILGPDGAVALSAAGQREDEVVRSAAFSDAGEGTAAVLVTTREDRGAVTAVLLWWRLGSNTSERRPLPTARRLAFAPDRAVLALAGTDGSVRVLEGPQGDPRPLPSTSSATRSAWLAWAPGGLLYAAEEDGISAWDVTRGVLLRRFGQGGVKALDVSPDGRTLVAASPNALDVWSTAGDRVRMAR